jgi:RNA polymerase sigma factor (sigma-70 family)
MTQEEKEKISGFEAARARLTSIAYRMLGSRAEAEDIVQDAWLKWHAAAEGDLRTPLAWLTTVTTRLAIDRIRRLQSEQAARASECLIEPWHDELAPSAEDEVERAASVSEAVALLFERLTPDERAAFVLHEAFDCDYAQIADVVGKTPAHCRQLAHRARQRLAGEPAREDGVRRRSGAPAGEWGADGVERLREVIRTADAVGVMTLFADRTMTVAAEAGAGAGSRPLRVAASGARGGDTATAAWPLEAYALPPDWGAAFVLLRAGEVVGVVRCAAGGARAVGGAGAARFTLVTRGAEVAELERRFGLRAISQLLARIVHLESTVMGCVD